MPRTKPKPASKPIPPTPVVNGAVGEVLTLAEAAAYPRRPEDAVQAAVQDQNLPGRFINGEWRFLKAGIQFVLTGSDLSFMLASSKQKISRLRPGGQA